MRAYINYHDSDTLISTPEPTDMDSYKEEGNLDVLERSTFVFFFLADKQGCTTRLFGRE